MISLSVHIEKVTILALADSLHCRSVLECEGECLVCLFRLTLSTLEHWLSVWIEGACKTLYGYSRLLDVDCITGSLTSLFRSKTLESCKEVELCERTLESNHVVLVLVSLERVPSEERRTSLLVTDDVVLSVLLHRNRAKVTELVIVVLTIVVLTYLSPEDHGILLVLEKVEINVGLLARHFNETLCKRSLCRDLNSVSLV